MRIPALPLIASVALLAAPAFAQTPGMNAAQQNATVHTTTNPHPGMAASQKQGATGTQSYNENSGSNQQANNGQLTQDTQQKLQQSLQQSGFKDVSVEPEAFIIHAQAPDGSRIVMEVSPDQAEGVVISNTGSPSQPNGVMQNGQNGSSNWSHGGPNR